MDTFPALMKRLVQIEMEQRAEGARLQAEVERLDNMCKQWQSIAERKIDDAGVELDAIHNDAIEAAADMIERLYDSGSQYYAKRIRALKR